jgi:Integrase core domain
VVPTVSFECLFALVVVGHGRRQLLWFAVTRHPTAEWLARQLVEAFPWNTAPAYLVRDNDGAYGQAFRRRVRAMGIRDRPISPRSPWQNPYAERLIGTLRRDCLDHVLIFGVQHLLRLLASYSRYYNETRTHLSLDKDAPLGRAVQRSGTIMSVPILSGLHHAMPGYDFREGQVSARFDILELREQYLQNLPCRHLPLPCFSTRTSCCASGRPAGTTIFPPAFN